MRVLVVPACYLGAPDISNKLEGFFEKESEVMIRSFDGAIDDLARTVAHLEPNDVAVFDLASQPEFQFATRFEVALLATCHVIVYGESDKRMSVIGREDWEKRPLVLSYESCGHSRTVEAIRDHINSLLILDCHNNE